MCTQDNPFVSYWIFLKISFMINAMKCNAGGRFSVCFLNGLINLQCIVSMAAYNNGKNN